MTQSDFPSHRLWSTSGVQVPAAAPHRSPGRSGWAADRRFLSSGVGDSRFTEAECRTLREGAYRTLPTFVTLSANRPTASGGRSSTSIWRERVRPEKGAGSGSGCRGVRAAPAAPSASLRRGRRRGRCPVSDTIPFRACGAFDIGEGLADRGAIRRAVGCGCCSRPLVVQNARSAWDIVWAGGRVAPHPTRRPPGGPRETIGAPVRCGGSPVAEEACARAAVREPSIWAPRRHVASGGDGAQTRRSVAIWWKSGYCPQIRPGQEWGGRHG